MTTLLNKDSIIQFLSLVHPDASINDDCVAAILQMVTPFNDLFTGKTTDECVNLVNTYFGIKLATFTLSQIQHPPDLHASSQEIIMECLISELLEISGNMTKDRISEDYIATHEDEDDNDDSNEDIILSVYDLYRGLVTNSELKQMFTAYLIPEWIITGKLRTNAIDTTTWLTLEEVEQLCKDFMNTDDTFEDKVIPSVYNLLTGCAFIYLTVDKNIVAPFITELLMTPWFNQFNPTGKIQRLFLSVILRSFRSKRLPNQHTFTFVNLVWVIKDNKAYPKFMDYLELYKE